MLMILAAMRLRQEQKFQNPTVAKLEAKTFVILQNVAIFCGPPNEACNRRFLFFGQNITINLGLGFGCLWDTYGAKRSVLAIMAGKGFKTAKTFSNLLGRADVARGSQFP